MPGMMPARLTVFRLITAFTVVLLPFTLGLSAPPPPLARPLLVEQHWYGDSYTLVGDYASFGWTVEDEDEMLGPSDSVNFHAYKPTFSGSLAVYLYFQDEIPFNAHVSFWASGSWTDIYVMDAENIWTLCETSPCDITGRTVTGMYFLANNPAFNDEHYNIDAIQVDFEDGSGTATPTVTRTSTPTRTAGPTHVSTCQPTFTPGPASTGTRTQTPFGLASRTPTRTPTGAFSSPTPSRTPTASPFPTMAFTDFGLGFVDEFTSPSSSLWTPDRDNTVSPEWFYEFGHTHQGSYRWDLSEGFDVSARLPRLLWAHPVNADYVLTGHLYFDNEGLDNEGQSMTVALINYIPAEGGWDATPVLFENSLELVNEEDANSWRIFRFTTSERAEAAAIVVMNIGEFDAGYLYIDDVMWTSRSNQGGGGQDCGPTATPAPMSTIPVDNPCDGTYCVGITHVPGTPPCLGYSGFDFEIPAVTTYTVPGVQVCFDRYEIGEVYLGPYDFDWLIYVALYGLPAMLVLWTVVKARS